MKSKKKADLKEIEEMQSLGKIVGALFFVLGVGFTFIPSLLPEFPEIELFFFATALLFFLRLNYWDLKWHVVNNKQEAKNKK